MLVCHSIKIYKCTDTAYSTNDHEALFEVWVGILFLVTQIVTMDEG